jgi:hypothetical protein
MKKFCISIAFIALFLSLNVSPVFTPAYQADGSDAYSVESCQRFECLASTSSQPQFLYALWREMGEMMGCPFMNFFTSSIRNLHGYLCGNPFLDSFLKGRVGCNTPGVFRPVTERFSFSKSGEYDRIPPVSGLPLSVRKAAVVRRVSFVIIYPVDLQANLPFLDSPIIKGFIGMPFRANGYASCPIGVKTRVGAMVTALQHRTVNCVQGMSTNTLARNDLMPCPRNIFSPTSTGQDASSKETIYVNQFGFGPAITDAPYARVNFPSRNMGSDRIACDGKSSKWLAYYNIADMIYRGHVGSFRESMCQECWERINAPALVILAYPAEKDRTKS